MSLRGSVVVYLLDAGPRVCVCGCRNLEISEGRPEVQAGASRNHRRPVPLDQMVDGVVCESRVLADGHRLSQLANRDQVRRLTGLVGEDGQAAIDLERVCGDDLGAERIGDAPGDGRLARRRRSEDRDHLIRQFGHVLWGTPAHHPLRA